MTNKRSNIIADKSLTITSGKNLNSIGTNFLAKKDKLLLNVGNDLNLQDTKDYVYDYDYTMRSKLDFGAAIVHVATAVAVGALTGGSGAAFMAGASSAGNARSLTKGKVDSEMTHDENIVSNSLQGKRVALNIGHGGTMANTIVNGHSIENLAMLEQYTKLKLQSKDNFSITTSEARHEHQINHDTWNANVGRAVLGGALTGLASGAGATGGKYLGNLTERGLANALGTTATNAVVAAVSASPAAYIATVGSAMSQVTMAGGKLDEVLGVGRDSITSSGTFKNVAIAGAIAGGASLMVDLSHGSRNLESGGEAVYKPNKDLIKQYPERFADYNGVIDRTANNIGMANVTDNIDLVGQPVDTSKFGFRKNLLYEGGKYISKPANKLLGMNSMSLMHDFWSHYAILGITPILQITIIPAIAIQYCALYPALCGFVMGESSNNNYEARR